MENETISALKQKPKFKITWWAMFLGLICLLEFPLLLAFSIFTGKPAATTFGPYIGLVGIALTISALITGIISYRKGERSWVLWLGFGPAILFGIFWLLMIIAEIFSIIFVLGF